MDNKKIPIIVVCGPTASGKTRLAVELAKHFGGEVVSADSMQIYKGLNIATAKPTADEMQGVPHHLIGFLPNDKKFSVADYLPLARACIKDIHSRGKLAIVCGGTGLYISSLLDNVRFEEIKSDAALRAELENRYKTEGAHAMWQKLFEIDPVTANNIHENNAPRVIRGIEAYMLTGKTLSQLRRESITEESDYAPCVIFLDYADRAVLYDRINKRVDMMLEDGLVEECRTVYEQGGLETAFQAIGYKELIPFFEGAKPLEDCVCLIKQETRHYAKRQLTWFRRMNGTYRADPSEFGDFKNFFENVLKTVAKSKIM